MNFNPIIYLVKINLLRKEDSSINEDIEKLEKHIDDNLKPFSTNLSLSIPNNPLELMTFLKKIFKI